MRTCVRALYQIDASPDGPAAARRIVDDELSGLVPERRLDDVKLMVSELVTNGIIHGATGENDTITLDLRVDGSIRCSVTDHGPGFVGRVALQRGPRWGLLVVEQLADRWGLQRSRHVTEVWFETERT